MKAMAPTNTPLDLSIQYACDPSDPDPKQWPIKQWIQTTLAGARNDAQCPTCPFPATAELTVRIVDQAEGQALNQHYRHKENATNVLTFAYEASPNGRLHADIVLCLPVVVAEAQDQRKALPHHAAHLVIHGVLHALGYDHNHADEAHQMELLEIELLRKLDIGNPYHLNAATDKP